jgi:HAMP domain-containing protein
MNALQQTLEPPNIRRKPMRRRLAQPKSHRYSNKAVALELTAKIIVNSLLSAAAVVTLIKLLPYQFSQQMKLNEVNTEVEEAERRVERLRENFRRSFDPQQSKKVMQEQSSRVDPQQRRIIFIEPSNQ